MSEKVERKTIVEKDSWNELKKDAIDNDSNGVQEHSGKILQKYEKDKLVPVEKLPEGIDYKPQEEEFEINEEIL